MRTPTARCKLISPVLALFLSSLLVGAVAVKPLPLVIWNATDSVPLGLYFMRKQQPKVGEIATIDLPDWVRLYASSRRYLPAKVWLLKPVFATGPSIICRFGRYIFVDGNLIARAKIFDRNNQLLPVWKGCRTLKPNQVFVLAKPPRSFDSRYFGPVDRSQIIGTAVPVYLP